MVKWIRYFSLLAFVSWPLFASGFIRPKVVTVFEHGCSPQTDCKTNFQGQEEDFTLRWGSYKEGGGDFFELNIEGDTFNIPLSRYNVSNSFSFSLFIFPNSIKLYGSLIGNETNYFLRDENGRFHYLGLTPYLFYDPNSGDFTGGINIRGGHIAYYYKLEKTSLVLKKKEYVWNEEK